MKIRSNSSKKYFKIIAALLTLCVFTGLGFYMGIHHPNQSVGISKGFVQIADEVADEEKETTYVSTATIVNTETMDVEGFSYAHYFLGYHQSIDILNEQQETVATYGFDLDGYEGTLEVVRVIDFNVEHIAIIDLRAYVEGLAKLQEERGPDNIGFENYFGREEMVIHQQNSDVTFKMYVDKVSWYTADDTVYITELRGLILLDPAVVPGN